MRDRRESLKKGTCINIAGGEYIVDECISSGGQALIYRCHLKGYESAQRYILKEYYPPEAVRENGVIEEGPEWKYRKSHSLEYYYQKAKKAEAYAAPFRQKSHQAQFVSEVIPDDCNMVALMRMASDDCKTIKQKLEEWYTGNLSDLEQHSDLYRVREGVKIIKGVLAALNMLHGELCGYVVHRDLTPGNILIAENRIGENTEYTIYPIDFSCSAPIGSPFDSEMSVSPGYTHPVLRENSHLLDLYSVAAILLVLVTGKECLHRVDNWEVNNLIVEDHFYIDEALSTLNIPRGVRSKLESVLKRAVSMRSADQYSSAEEMYTELETLEEIIDCREMHPEVFFDASATEFREQCKSRDGMFRYEVERDLVTEAIDRESHQPINLLEKNTILLGGGGAGKTTKIRTLWEDCLTNWNIDRESSPIPIFVPLNTFDSGEDGKNFIKDYIAKRYFPNLSKDDSDRRSDLMGMLRSHGRYVLFLDGINEAVGNDKLNAEIADFAAIENVTVLITSRNDWGDDETKKLFSTAELMPLNDDLIIKKLHDKVLGAPSARLLETLRRPMFLAMYLKLKITDQKVETPGQILREHHNYLIEAFKTSHHCDALECFKLVVQQILPKVASSINSMMCDSEQIYEVVKDIHFKSARFRDIADSLGRNKLSRNATSILQNCGILRKMNEDDEGIESFIFTHQNYLEFYQAYDVYKQMRAHKKEVDLPNALAKSILPDSVMHFLGDLLGEHEFQKKMDCTGDPSPVEEWMQLHCAGRKDHAVQMAVRNLVEVMKRSRERFITANYSNLDLSLANFYDCFLQNSLFTNATITDVTFLRYGHRQPVDVIALLHSPERLVTGCWGEKDICIWDITTGQIVQRITHTDAIGWFEISSDEQLILVRTLGNVTIYKISDGEKVNEMELYSLDASMMQQGRHELVGFCADNCAIFCSYGKSGEDQVRLWDVYTGDSRPVINLSEGYQKAPGAKTQCCTVSADRKTLYAVSNQGELSIWSMDHYTCRKSFLVFSRVEGIVVTPDEKYAVMLTDDYALLVLDLITGEIEKVCDHMENDSNGRIQERNLIIATNRYLIWAGNHMLGGYVFGSRERISFHAPQISSLCVDEKGEQLFLSEENGRIKIGSIQEKRILASFDCGQYANWSEPHSIVPHVYDNGVARITRNNHVQCLQTEGAFVIANNRNVCNCFDDNYHICVEANPEGDDHLVVRDLRTSTIVASISDDLLCIAHDGSGEEIFGTRSDFRWAKYYESEQKLVVNYWAGLTKIWDVHTQQWKPAGDWAAEVSHILSYCNEAEWDTMRDELIKTSKRCFPIGAYVVCGTHNGHVQFWNLSGSKVADIVAHNSSVERMYAVPGGKYFVSQGIDESRCIWNVETFEKICWDVHTSLINEENILGAMTVSEAIELGINLHSNPFIEPQSADGDLIVYYEVAEGIVLLACSEKEQIPSKRIVSDSGEIVVYFDDPDVFEKPYNSYIRVYNARTQRLLHNYDLFLSKREALDDNYVEFTNYAVNISLHERSGKLAAAFADGTVLLFDLLQRTPWACFTWDVIGAEDVSNCDFTDVDVKQESKRVLLQNGAKF